MISWSWWLPVKYTQIHLLSVAHPSTSVLTTPRDLGLYATRNFYIKYRDEVEEQNVTLGVWHILPNFVANKFSNELGLEEVHFLNYICLKIVIELKTKLLLYSLHTERDKSGKQHKPSSSCKLWAISWSNWKWNQTEISNGWQWQWGCVLWKNVARERGKGNILYAWQ